MMMLWMKGKRAATAGMCWPLSVNKDDDKI